MEMTKEEAAELVAELEGALRSANTPGEWRMILTDALAICDKYGLDTPSSRFFMSLRGGADGSRRASE